MKIAEIFRSLQGEGRLTGVDSMFVRVSGCNLRCGFCDTPYASWSPEGDDLSVEKILEKVQPRHSELAVKHSSPHIVITGGEPMLFADMVPLTAALRKDGWHITIETSGTVYLPVVCDLMSISPKLSNSTPLPEHDPHWAKRHEANRHLPEVIGRLISEYDYQLKFVIDSLADCEEVEEYLTSMPQIDRGRVMLMPQGADTDEVAEKNQWLEAYCWEHQLVFCPRRHLEWFGPGRGK